MQMQMFVRQFLQIFTRNIIYSNKYEREKMRQNCCCVCGYIELKIKNGEKTTTATIAMKDKNKIDCEIK